MPVINVHERTLNASITETGKLIDGLASSDDKLWPHDRWPAMKFDRPLEVGAIGGHGPIRYTVESYKPGRYIQFRFIEPTGFLCSHRFEVEMAEHKKTKLRHLIKMQTTGVARLIWPLAIRPLHNALLEDALDRAAVFTGGKPVNRDWSFWVKFLRRVISRGR